MFLQSQFKMHTLLLLSSSFRDSLFSTLESVTFSCCLASLSSISLSRAVVSTGLALPKIEAADGALVDLGAVAGLGASVVSSDGGGSISSIGLVRGAKFNFGRVRGSAIN